MSGHKYGLRMSPLPPGQVRKGHTLMPPTGQSARAPGAKTYWPDGLAASLRRRCTDSKEPWPLC
jgi:hypothetical protein